VCEHEEVGGAGRGLKVQQGWGQGHRWDLNKLHSEVVINYRWHPSQTSDFIWNEEQCA